MSKPTINGIDVSKYFIDVVDEGGSTIDYKILPNTERLLVEKIFEQNQQLKRLQEENKELKDRNTNLRLNLATYDLPEIKKVLTDWRTGKLDKKFKKLQKENEKLKQALEEIKTFAKPIKENTCFGMYCGFVDFVLEQCKEALNDRD